MDAHQTLFLRAARRERVERTPVWFMRQAGRVLPEYRRVRERRTLFEICREPELCAEVTLQPVERLGVDAAILFSDIMLPLLGVGVEVELVDGVGPVLAAPIRDAAGVRALRPLEPEADIPYLMESVHTITRALGGRLPLIGLSGAPFTLASYLIEGHPSRDFIGTKTMMYEAPALWRDLMERLCAIVIPYLRAQVGAGAQALQLFDSWVGCLSPADYACYVQPYVRRIFGDLRGLGVPLIHFGVNSATLLEQMREDGGTVIGLDWRIPLDEGWRRVGHELGVQGNLDPAALFGPQAHIRSAVGAVLDAAAGRPGHLFNLGHGLHPQTPVEHVQYTVDCVRELSAAAVPPAFST